MLPHYQEIPEHEMRAYVSVSYVCAAIYNAMSRASANSSPGKERKSTVSNSTTAPASLAECSSCLCMMMMMMMKQEFVFPLPLSLQSHNKNRTFRESNSNKA